MGRIPCSADRQQHDTPKSQTDAPALPVVATVHRMQLPGSHRFKQSVTPLSPWRASVSDRPDRPELPLLAPGRPQASRAIAGTVDTDTDLLDSPGANSSVDGLPLESRSGRSGSGPYSVQPHDHRLTFDKRRFVALPFRSGMHRRCEAGQVADIKKYADHVRWHEIQLTVAFSATSISQNRQTPIGGDKVEWVESRSLAMAGRSM